MPVKRTLKHYKKAKSKPSTTDDKSIEPLPITEYFISDIKYDTDKVVKMYLNITKFKKFYKNLTIEERNVIDNYKRWGYENLNRFLYSGYKLDKLIFPDYMGFFQEDQKPTIPKYILKYMNYKTKDFINKPEFITTFMNKLIINRISEIDKLFTKPHIPKLYGTEFLYRGTNGNIITDENTKIGDELVFKNYTSSTISRSVALNFTNIKTTNINNACCLFILTGLKNIPYIYLPWFEVYKNKNIADSHIINADDDEAEYLLPRNLKFKITNITTGLPLDNTKAYANKTFKQIGKTIKLMNTTRLAQNSLTNEDYLMLIPELFKDIKVYHLLFVEQLENESFPQYVYKGDIEIINNSKIKD